VLTSKGTDLPPLPLATPALEFRHGETVNENGQPCALAFCGSRGQIPQKSYAGSTLQRGI
jgi:hypothetical protein